MKDCGSLTQGLSKPSTERPRTLARWEKSLRAFVFVVKRGGNFMKNETGALTQPTDQELDAILKHRLAGHRIRFRPSEVSADIECLHCKSEILSGVRHEVEILYECALQFFPYGAAVPDSTRVGR